MLIIGSRLITLADKDHKSDRNAYSTLIRIYFYLSDTFGYFVEKSLRYKIDLDIYDLVKRKYILGFET